MASEDFQYGNAGGLLEFRIPARPCRRPNETGKDSIRQTSRGRGGSDQSRNPSAGDACPQCPNMFGDGQILYKFVPLLRLEVWICRKLCVYLYIKPTRACVNPAPRPISWTGKAGVGVFSVDGKVGGEWKNLL